MWWRYGVYIKIQSIELSLLGGRLMFRNISYIGTSHALHIVHGSLSWKYWLQDRRRSRLLSAKWVVQKLAEQAEMRAEAAEEEEKLCEKLFKEGGVTPETLKYARKEAKKRRNEAKRAQSAKNTGSNIQERLKKNGDDNDVQSAYNSHLEGDVLDDTQSAFALKIYGVEWFVYNREYAYEALSKKEAPLDEIADQWKQGLSSIELWFAEMLPLQIDAHQVGAVFGNYDTESLMVLTTPLFSSIVDMAPPSNDTDRYMARIDSNLHVPEVELRPNPDYNASLIFPATNEKKERKKRFIWAKKMTQESRPWYGLRRYAAEENADVKQDASYENGSDDEKNTGQKSSNADSNSAQKESTTHSDSVSDDDTIEVHSDDGNSVEQNDEKRDIKSRLANLPVEYAKVTQVIACDYAKFRMSIDAVGIQTEDSPPPLYDMQMEIQNAKITYGPYAERQRQTFFSVFFPRNCSTPNQEQASSTDDNVTEKPSDEKLANSDIHNINTSETSTIFESTRTTGPMPDSISDLNRGNRKARLHPKATVSVALQGETALVIPVRESSKDPEFIEAFTKHYKSFGSNLQRSFGWLEIRAEPNSKIDVSVPFIPNDDGGYDTSCAIDLVKPYVRSSVNHEMMFRALKFNLRIDQYQPPVWNDVNTYTIKEEAVDFDYFILREHSNLIEDALTDFSDGPEVPYELFTPTVYNISFDIRNMNLFFNVNKGNIINSPTSLSENTFLVMSTPEVNIASHIPRTDIVSPTSKVHTLITAPHVDLDLSAPNWHTLQEFLDTKRLATVENFSVKLEHLMSNVTSELNGRLFRDPGANTSRLVNTQILDISGSQLVFMAHGFCIEYIMRIRENYFGHAYHFKTTEEFLQSQAQYNTRADGEEVNPRDESEFTRLTEDSDSQMRIRVDRGVFLIPVRLYSSSSCIAFQFASMDVECRFTNYYMDLQVEVAPVLSRLLHKLNPGTVHEEARQASFASADLSISSLNVHAHRMFGLPPVEPTYVVRWDFELGDITTDLTLDYPSALGDAVEAFSHSIDDDENKPVMPPEELYDVTFVTLKIASLVAVIRPSSALDFSDHTRVELRTASISLKTNDLMNERYSALRSIEIPYVRFRVYVQDNSLAMDSSTAIRLSGFLQMPLSDEKYERQQEHIALHDSLFQRAPFLLDHKRRNRFPYKRKPQTNDILVCTPLPDFPPPLTQDSVNTGFTAEGLFSDGSFTSIDSESDMGSSAIGTSGIGNSATTPSFGGTSRVGTGTTGLESTGFTTNDSFVPSDSLSHSNSSNGRYIMDENIREDPVNPSDDVHTMYDDADVFPFSSDTTTEDREWLRSRKAWFNLKARPWSFNAPKLFGDPESEINSLVVQILPVKVQLTPKMLSVASAFEQKGEVDFEAQLDALQVRILIELMRSKLNEVFMSLHVIVPSFTVDLSEKIGSAHSIHLQLDQADFMYSSDRKMRRGVHIDFKSLLVSVRQGDAADFAQVDAATLVLSKFDAWWQQTSKKDSTGSMALANIDTSFASDKIDWTIHYISQLMMTIPNTTSRADTGPSKQKILLSTFYALTMAGEQMGVEQDSYVLSRPSGAVQSKDHVRTNISWRIVMRLRYLLHRIPSSEKRALQNAIAKEKFEIPSDAKAQLLDVYRQWRSWEQSRNIEDTEIFHLVFDDLSFQEYVLSLSTRVEIVIESMVARVVYPSGDDHFAGTTGLSAHMYSTKQNETQVLSLNFSCGRIHALGSMALVIVAANAAIAVQREMIAFARKEYSVHREETASSSSSSTFVSAKSSLYSSNSEKNIEENATELADAAEEEAEAKAINLGNAASNTPTSSENDENETPQTALQVNISFFLLDLILEFGFDTVTVETQNHQVQFTAAVELMKNNGIQSLFHTGTLISANGAFRVLHKSHADIIDALVSGVKIGYASRGFEGENKSWASVDVESASLVTRKTIEQLMILLVEFLQDEIPRARQIAEKLQDCVPRRESTDAGIPSSQKDSASSHAERGFETEGKFLNFNVRTLKLRARLFDNFKLVWIGRGLVFKLRTLTEGGALRTIGSLDVQKNSTAVHFGDGSAAVVNLQLENIRSVMQYGDHDLSLFNDVSVINAETMSFVWLLEYAQRNRIDAQFRRIKDSLEHAIDLVGSAAHTEPTSEEPIVPTTDPSTKTSPSKLNIKVVNRTSLISIKLPLDKSPLDLKIEGARLVINQHKGGESFEFKGGLDNFSLDLASIRRPPRRLIHFKFNVSTRIDDAVTLVNVKSDFIHFAFDPEAVGAIYLAMQKLESYAVLFNKPDSLDSPTSDDDDSAYSLKPVNSVSSTASILSSTKKSKSAVHALEKLRLSLQLNGFTITWFTNSKSSEGATIGYEQLKIEVSNLAARVALADAYFTPIGNTSLAMKDRVNTIYLPLLEAKAFITQPESGKPLFTAEITGKTVALSVVPSIGPWAIQLADSFIDTRKTLDQLNRIKLERLTRLRNVRTSQQRTGRPQLRVNTGGSSQAESSKRKVEIPIDFKLSTSFDRSVLRVYADGGRKLEPALELFSPKVDLNVEFAESKLMIRFIASQTSNTMYPMALSEIRAFLTLLSASLKQRSIHLARSISSPVTADIFNPYASPPPMLSTNYYKDDTRNVKDDDKKEEGEEEEDIPNIFNDLELDAQVHFGAQVLHLSSHPYSKVGALLETDGVDVLFTTPTSSSDDKSFYALYNVIKRTRISLQHMYSREISAMIEVSRFCAVGLYRHDEPFKLAMDISAVNLELDLSKLHDTRIFFEIWSLYSANSETNGDDDFTSHKLRRRRSTNSRTTHSLLASPLFGDSEPVFEDDENEASPSSSSSSRRSKHGSDGASAAADPLLIEKYKNAVSQLPLMYVMNFSIQSIDSVVKLGTSIGEARVHMDRMWLALIKSSIFDQMLNLGVNSVAAHFEGRLGGTIKIDNIMAKMALTIREKRNYPLVHSKIRLGNINFYLGLDFHPFIAGNVSGLLAVLTTQEKEDVADDRIHTAITCDAVSIALTALIVVHAHDVLSLFKRLQSQISLAPTFMSDEAAEETANRSVERSKRRQRRILDYIDIQNGMRILIDLRLGEFLLHVFATDFSDSLSLKIAANHVETHLDRHNLADVFKVGIDLAVDECTVSIANHAGGGYKQQLAELDCNQFLEFIQRSSNGGTIVKSPEVTILMDTWEYKSRPREILYTFSNQIRGSIDFGWNLGSVNFIKEMHNAHKEAWSLRQDVFEAAVQRPEEGNPSAQALREAAANIERPNVSLKEMSTLSPRYEHRRKRSTMPKINYESLDAHFERKELASDPEKTPSTPLASSSADPLSVKTPSTASPSTVPSISFMDFKYIAKTEPDIRIPQIRDLGDATPPIEWLGVNRERIPVLINYFYTRQAVKAANEIEKLFLALIGRLD